MRSMRAQVGLTLIELLVALAIFVVLSSVLYGGLRFGSRVWSSVVGAAQDRGDVIAAQNFLRSRIERAQPGRTFRGVTDSLTLTAPAPQGAASQSDYEYALSVASPRNLILRYAVPSDAAGSREEVLYQGVERLQIAYLQRDGVWADRWAQETALPAAVRIRAISDAGESGWPTLIVRPLVTAATDCVFDAVTMGCR